MRQQSPKQLPEGYVHNGLGKLLHAWRTGWRLLPGTSIWFRMSPSLDYQHAICELLPTANDFKTNERGSRYVPWWGDEKGVDLKGPAATKLMEGFYVYRQLAPITQYTTFLLRADDGTLVEGSVSHDLAQRPTEAEYRKLEKAREKMPSLNVLPPTAPLRLRFKILARDGFRCRYCGRTAEETELQVDHVVPRSKGGGYNEDNLVTACRACNIGKSDVLLEVSVPV